MSFYGYNVYDLYSYPRYPILCLTIRDVEKITSSDPKRYCVVPRLSPEDNDTLELNDDDPFLCS